METKQQDLFDAGPRLINRERRPFFAHHATPGNPYRPSNGSEGSMFQECWCECCEKNPDDGEEVACCPILLASMCFEVNDPKYPKEWRIGIDGQPECTAFVEASK